MRGKVALYNASDITGNFLSRILDGAKSWDNLGQSLNFVRIGVNEESLLCTERPKNYNVIYQGAQQAAASTRRCLYSNGILIYNFNMKFSDAETWYTGTSQDPPATGPDTWSVATHEFGHAGGWRRH